MARSGAAARRVIVIASPFSISVAHIVQVRAAKEMSGIAAGRVIAVMADMPTRRDRSVGQHPGDAMSPI